MWVIVWRRHLESFCGLAPATGKTGGLKTREAQKVTENYSEITFDGANGNSKIKRRRRDDNAS
jgi:hypothetical protein